MKCSHCGGNLSLKDEYCPHCGQFNEQSAQHISDMRHYKGQFDETHRSVWARLWKYQSVSVRVVVLAVMMILTIAAYFADRNLYSIERRIQDYRAALHVDSNIEQIDAYLASENYIDLYYYLCANRIGTYSYLNDPYEGYYPLRMGCMYYSDVYCDLMLFATQDNENTGRSYITGLEGDLESFYYYTSEDSIDYCEDVDVEQTMQAFSRMRANVDALLITYGGLTEEEAAQFPEMNSAQRAVLLAERKQQ